MRWNYCLGLLEVATDLTARKRPLCHDELYIEACVSLLRLNASNVQSSQSVRASSADVFLSSLLKNVLRHVEWSMSRPVSHWFHILGLWF